MAQKIQLRRGLEAQRTLITPDVGEPLFTTDNKEFFVGDGATAGGIKIGGGSVVTVHQAAGTQAIGTGADSVTVTDLGLAWAPTQTLVTVRKAAGGLNLFATVRDGSMTADGFIADLSGVTDAATYKLDYLLIS